MKTAATTKSCRTSLTLESAVKEQAGAFFADLGMDMSTGVNMIRTGKFPVSLDRYTAPERIADLTAEEKAQRAAYAVAQRGAIPQAAAQQGYVMSFDPETGRPVRLYSDGRRESCE